MTDPVGDSVPKTDGAVAVGEDLRFQKRWWRFERIVWCFFALVLVADVSGILGRGPLAKTTRHTGDDTLTIHYERVQRANTASIMTFQPGASAIRDGHLQLYVSEVLLKQLGAQRVIPAPATSVIGDGGVTYTFPATSLPMTVEIELKPSFVGRHRLSVRVPGRETLEATVLVLP